MQLLISHYQKSAFKTGLRFSLILILLVVLVSPYLNAQAAVPAGYSEYFVPGGTDQLWGIFEDNDNSPDLAEGSGMHAVIAVTAGSDSTTIYYDHWENGYDADGDEVYTVNKSDVTIFESSNIPVIPRGTDMDACTAESPNTLAGTANRCYDGRDRILVAGGAATVTRAAWPESVGTVYALSWELIPTKPFLTDYTLPIGVDLNTDKGYNDFANAYVIVLSTEDGNSITIDDPSTVGVDVSTTLNQGEVAELYNFNTGTTITGSSPLQVQMIAGDFNSNAPSEFRGFSVIPDTLWDNEYYSPVDGIAAGSYVSEIYVYNPHAGNLTVNYEDLAGSGSFVVAPGDTVAYTDPAAVGREMPSGSAAYLSADEIFWAIGSSGSENADYDWGYSLVPANALTTEYLVGWAPGSSNLPPTENGSPLFITPVEDDTTIVVTYNPSGTTATYNLDRLEVQTVFDPDDDNTGMLITADKPIAVAWGEDPDAPGISIGTPYLDMGYTTLPFITEAIDLVIGFEKNTDVDSVSTSGTVTFTLRAETYSTYAPADVDFRDTLPSGWSYVAGSTQITDVDGTVVSGASYDPSGAPGPDLSWDLSALGVNNNMDVNDTLILSFQAQASSTPGTYTNEAQVQGAVGSDTFIAEDEAVVSVGNFVVDKDTTTPEVLAGGTATYTLTLENIGTDPITGATMADPLPTGFTYASSSETLTNATKTSVTDDFSDTSNPVWGSWTIEGGGSVVVTMQVDVANTVALGTYDNNLQASSVEYADIDDLGNSGQDDDTPTGQDPETDEDVTVRGATIDKDTSTSNVAAGEDATYTITVNNLTGSAISGITVNDTLPSDFTFSATQPGTSYSGSYTQGAGFAEPGTGDTSLSWGPWTINAASSLTITFNATVSASAIPGTYDNTASATSATFGTIDDLGNTDQDADTPDSQDPETDEDVTVGLPPDLSITQDASGDFERGGTGVFTLSVTNDLGTSNTSGTVTVTDTLPSGVTLSATPTGSGWTCTGAAGDSTFTCTRSDALSPGSSYPDINVLVDIDDGAADLLTNLAAVSGGGDPVGDSSSLDVVISDAPAGSSGSPGSSGDPDPTATPDDRMKG